MQFNNSNPSPVLAVNKVEIEAKEEPKVAEMIEEMNVLPAEPKDEPVKKKKRRSEKLEWYIALI